MNKLILLFNILFLGGVLSACGVGTGTPIEPNENNMIIHIKNNSDFDFYGIELAVLNHSQGSVNADGSKIGKDEVLTFEFLKEDFELDGVVDMEVFILTDVNIEGDGDRVPLKRPVTIELRPNQEIVFELIGSSISEADLKRVQ